MASSWASGRRDPVLSAPSTPVACGRRFLAVLAAAQPSPLTPDGAPEPSGTQQERALLHLALERAGL